MDPLAVFFDSIGQSVQVAQALRAAAQQQQQFEQEQRLRESEFGLKQDQFANAQRNQAWEQDQAGQARDRQGQVDLMTALEKGGRPVQAGVNGYGPTYRTDTDIPRVSVDERGNQTPAGSGVNLQADLSRVANVGGRQVYMPTPEETGSLEARLKAGEAAAANDATMYSLPDALSAAWEKRSELPAGSLKGMQVPKTAVPNLMTSLLKEPGAEKPGAKHFLTIGETPVIVDPETGEATKIKLPAGVTPGPSAAQLEIDARTKERREDRKQREQERDQDANQKVIETLTGKAEKLEAEAAQHRQLQQEYQSIIGRQNGEMVVDPMDRNRAQRKLDAATRTRMAQGFMGAKTKAEGIEKQAKSLRDEIGARQKKFAAPQQGQSRGQLTDPSIAQQYLQRAGGDVAKARTLAKADGWEF